MKRKHRKAHAVLWRVLAIALPLALFAALVIRQSEPASRLAVKLPPTEAVR